MIPPSLIRAGYSSRLFSPRHLFAPLARAVSYPQPQRGSFHSSHPVLPRELERDIHTTQRPTVSNIPKLVDTGDESPPLLYSSGSGDLPHDDARDYALDKLSREVYNNTGEVQGVVHSIDTFSTVDGPGIRCMIFLSKCGLRCKFCCNPDTWTDRYGTLRSSRSVMRDVKKCASYLRPGNGGITISGGDPLLQPDYCVALMKEAHEAGLTTALDTAGIAPRESWAKVLPHTDYVLFCPKAFDPVTYTAVTRRPESYYHLSREFAKEVGKRGIPIYLRCVVVPGLTDSDAHIQEAIQFARDLPSVAQVDVLPYHVLGVNKWEELGLKYPLDGIEPLSVTRLQEVREMFRDAGVAITS